MLRNYLTIAFRNLWRNRLYTALNVAGLAVGISACLVIYLLASFELSFDRFHPDRERIYRVYTQFTGTFSGTNYGVTAPLPFTIREQVTGIETVVAFHTQHALTATVENKAGKDKVFKEQNNVVITEPQYFEVFDSYQWLAGSPKTSLTEPFRVVLTESKARTYFGITDATQAVGRTLHYNNSLIITVSGVVKDLPKTTDLYFTDFISFATIQRSWLKNNIQLDADSWGSTNSASQAWIELLPGVEPSQIEVQLRKIAEKYATDEENPDWKTHFRLQALPDLHFSTDIGIFDGSRAPVHPVALRLLIIVALLLLVIAAINFINLVTAQAVKRAKEVGVRKVLGSTRRELVLQFLSETALITTFAVLLSILIASLSLKLFDEFIPDGVALRLTDPFTIGFLLLTTLVVSLLSGVYPALVLSSFEPVQALKGTRRGAYRQSGAFLRQSLIVFQFAFAQVLIVGTFIVGSQIDFMLNQDMGFNQDAIVHLSTPYKPIKDQRAVMKQQLSRLPGIKGLSMHTATPASNGVGTSTFEYNNGGKILRHNVHRKYGDTAYIHLYDIPLLAGRNLIPSDTVREYLINETYAKLLGFDQPEQAVGKVLEKKYPIVGVVKDFHVQSLHNAVPPVAISSDLDMFRTFSLKLSTQGKGVGDFQATMKQVEQLWQQLYPEYDFTYQFVDETIAKFYESEQRMQKLASTATGIAIFISCLGLFGLATYTAEQRTKEIGIRKVLGASVQNIVTLLSKGFVKLVLLALVVATPIAWYAISKWLENFAYPVAVQWWMFALPGVAALLIALLTVSYQAIKAALANPVESLRNE